MAFKSLTVQMKILLHPIIYRMDTKILLYSTENFIQYPVTTIMERNMKNVHIYIYIYLSHFAVEQKLTQHCKLTVLQ